MTLATYEDVEASLGRSLSDTERTRVVWWLTGAETQIRARLGDVSLLDQETVRYVEAEAVAARMTNPDAYQSETIDDYTYRYGSETRAVHITAEQWAMLSQQADGSSTRPGFEPDTDATDPGLNWS